MKNEFNKNPNYLPFKFEYKNYKNPPQKKISIKNIFLLTVIAISITVVFMNIKQLFFQKSLDIKVSTYQVDTTIQKFELFNDIGYQKRYNDYVDKHNQLSGKHANHNYEYDFNTLTNVKKSEFLQELQNFTLHYERIDEKQYKILQNYLKYNPEFYKFAISILIVNNQPLAALLLHLDIAPKINNQYKYEDSFDGLMLQIINSELYNPLIIKLAENKFLSKEFKENLAKKMIIKLDDDIIISEESYNKIFDLKFSQSDIKTKLNITDEEIKKYIKKSLILESSNATKNIFKLYPDADEYYSENIHWLKGIMKYELLKRDN